MNKYYGAIGYSETIETSPGIWTEIITERNYYGDVSKISRRFMSGDTMNGNVEIDNQISVVADAYAMEHFHSIRYITWYNKKWTITSIDVEPPRLIFRLGGIYNEDEN